MREPFLSASRAAGSLSRSPSLFRSSPLFIYVVLLFTWFLLFFARRISFFPFMFCGRLFVSADGLPLVRHLRCLVTNQSTVPLRRSLNYFPSLHLCWWMTVLFGAYEPTTSCLFCDLRISFSPSVHFCCSSLPFFSVVLIGVFALLFSSCLPVDARSIRRLQRLVTKQATVPPRRNLNCSSSLRSSSSLRVCRWTPALFGAYNVA